MIENAGERRNSTSDILIFRKFDIIKCVKTKKRVTRGISLEFRYWGVERADLAAHDRADFLKRADDGIRVDSRIPIAFEWSREINVPKRRWENANRVERLKEASLGDIVPVCTRVYWRGYERFAQSFFTRRWRARRC
jgi:hypothetical protein